MIKSDQNHSCFLEILAFEQKWTYKQKVGHCDKTEPYIFFFTILYAYGSLIFHAKIQPKIPGGSGEEDGFSYFCYFQ